MNIKSYILLIINIIRLGLCLRKPKRFSSINFYILLIISTLLITCQTKQQLPIYNTPDFTPQWLGKNEIKQAKIHTIAPFKFTDQSGQSFDNQQLKGKIHVANFFFTSCGSICPTMTKNLQVIQDKFAQDNDIELISYSVTPWIDSLPKLQKYAEKYQIKPQKWHLLTGNKGEIYKLARQSYFAESEPGFNRDSTEFLHTEQALLVDKKGRIRGVYNATLPLEIQKMLEDILVLKQE